jgi:hypothetical protein
MSDGGEGLVDATTRLAERMEEMEEARRTARAGGPPIDPERQRALESLRLAKADFQRQISTTTHDGRRRQLQAALDEVERRLAALEASAPKPA